MSNAETKLKQNRNFRAYLKELENWMQHSDQNGGMEFAFNNGFLIHAVSLWMGTGASQLNLPLKIPHKIELKEIHELCGYADIFVCPDCNHHSFFRPGEIETDETDCEACLKVMKIDSRGK